MTMSVLAEFAMFPTDHGESVGDYVARVVEIVDRSGLEYKLGAMGTTMEGEIDEVLDVVKRCLMALQRDSKRVSCRLDLDWRAGVDHALSGKVASVQARLDHPIRT